MSPPVCLSVRRVCVAITRRSAPPTAPTTGSCVRETKALCRRPSPPSDPFQSASTPRGTSLFTTVVVGDGGGVGSCLYPKVGGSWEADVLFIWDSAHFRGVQRPRLQPDGKPRGVSCWLRHRQRTRLLAGEEQVRQQRAQARAQLLVSNTVAVLLIS